MYANLVLHAYFLKSELFSRSLVCLWMWTSEERKGHHLGMPRGCPQYITIILDWGTTRLRIDPGPISWRISLCIRSQENPLCYENIMKISDYVWCFQYRLPNIDSPWNICGAWSSDFANHTASAESWRLKWVVDQTMSITMCILDIFFGFTSIIYMYIYICIYIYMFHIHVWYRFTYLANPRYPAPKK